MGKTYKITESLSVRVTNHNVTLLGPVGTIVFIQTERNSIGLLPEEAALLGRYLIDISDPAKVETGMVGATVEQSEDNVPVPEQTMNVDGKRHKL